MTELIAAIALLVLLVGDAVFYALLMNKLRTKMPLLRGYSVRSWMLTGNWGLFFSNLSFYRTEFGKDKVAMRLWWLTTIWGVLLLISLFTLYPFLCSKN